jgi:tripartite-type tricarboxylate transporter receptor subunit TctC
MRFNTVAGAIAASALFLITPVVPAKAQTPAQFYAGKTVELHIGYSVGGGYDLYARTIAKHLGKHIPGKPTVVPKNVTGAGSLRLANWIYNAAPKDGTMIGAIGRAIAFNPLLEIPGSSFDATKFTWLGSANDDVSLCVSWKNSGIAKFEDLMTKEMTVGGTGGGSDTDAFPKVLSGVLGAKLKLVTGYPGGNDVNLALERGEVDGRCGWSWTSLRATRGEWVKEKSVNILVQLSLAKHKDLPDVPLVIDLAKNEQQRQILKLIFARQVMGFPYIAPPEVPRDRAEALQNAFMDTMRDKDFIQDAEKLQLEITPVSGPDVKKLVEEIYSMPAEVASKAAILLQ